MTLSLGKKCEYKDGHGVLCQDETRGTNCYDCNAFRCLNHMGWYQTQGFDKVYRCYRCHGVEKKRRKDEENLKNFMLFGSVFILLVLATMGLILIPTAVGLLLIMFILGCFCIFGKDDKKRIVGFIICGVVCLIAIGSVVVPTAIGLALYFSIKYQ